MTSWSATMSPALLLKCVLATWLFIAVGAITVSIDRADVKAPPTRSSMIANGWRPLTNSYEETIGTNVSPSSHLEKNVQVHPVLNKFQEHMATSEKLKPPRKSKPPVHEYSPPSILGSFSVFGHAATKARGETKAPSKHVASETREYTFLIPPPKDAYRFEMNQHRKPVLRDNANYLRQPQPYVAGSGGIPHQQQQQQQQQHLEPLRAGTYFIKNFATSNRPYVPPYAMPQALQPPRSQQAAKPFESLKVGGNAKPYFQPPVADVAGEFGNKQKSGNDRDAYDVGRYQASLVAQSHNQQILSSASSGNFYSQINHPPSHFKSTYERDPAFLVHESHEVSYVTPSAVTYNGYNFRPSLPYETLLPPAVYTSSSTSAPSTTAVTRNPGQYGQTSEAATREHDLKRTEPSSRNKQDKNAAGNTEPPNSRTTSTYYVSEGHHELTPPSTWPKNKYASDINEVLPRENPPTKFSQEIDNQNQIAYRRPHNPYEPVEVYPPTTVEYETPESISLKHFNEQQLLLQQQLLQRDRERLVEQERQQKLEIERQQQEELKKRRQELSQLFQQEKEEEEAARLAAESAKNQSQELIRITGDMPYTIQLAQFEPQVTTQGSSILVSQPGVYNVEPLRVQSQVPENQVNYPYQQHFQNEYQEQQVDYRDPQAEVRPYRPQKPSRDPHRRKKPSTAAYDIAPTEPPSQPADTSVPLTLHEEEVPVQTTVAPESQTLPAATTQKARPRRPGASHRRRKPSTTTQEPVTVSHQEEDFLKYNRGSEDAPANHYDPSRRRRIKPTQVSYTDDDTGTGTDKKTNSRKRPSHRTRVNHLSESFDAEVVTENAHSSYGHATEPAAGYNNENSQYATNQPGVVSYGTTGQTEEQYITSQPINQYYDYTSQLSEVPHREDHHEDTIAPPVQVEYYGDRDKAAEDYGVDTRQQQNPSTSIPLEELYVRTDDGNYYDRATTVAPTTTTTTTATTTTTRVTTTTGGRTTTTPQPTTQSAQVVSSTLKSHKTRPLRYGNATRPRFSIKDYKSRLDYKTRLQLQSSTTELAPTPAAEASTRAPYTKHRTSSARTQQQQQQAQQQAQQSAGAEPVRETTGRYKYVSRMNYRTTTSAAPTVAAREHERFPEEGASSTTEKSNRFVPKRRPISSNVYRSRIASTTSSPARSQANSDSSVRQSSVRPENVYSSSVRRRPVAKSRPHHPHKEAVAAAAAGAHPERRRQQQQQQQEPATEMAAEETSFYAAMSTTAASTTHLVANEIVSEKTPLDGHVVVKLGVQESKSEGQRAEAVGTSAPPGDETGQQELQARAQLPSETSQVQPEAPAASDNDNGDKVLEVSRKEAETETTTKFDVRSDEEELFAKASQSVADLTSSASALYDKPGMFKAVSPESRLVSSAHFKIATDEPTLPIEAFFQELTKKN